MPTDEQRRMDLYYFQKGSGADIKTYVFDKNHINSFWLNRLIPYGVLSQVKYKGKLIYCMLLNEGSVDCRICPGFSEMYLHTGGETRYVAGSIQRVQEPQIVIGRDPMEPRL